MKEKIFVFLGLAAAAFIAYRNCFGIDIPTDSYPLLMTFQKFGAAGLFHNFYDVGMAPFADSIIFILYKLIGTNGSWWIFTSLLLHVNNAFLLHIAGKYFFQKAGIKHALQLSLFSSLLFLLSPFQTEVILWAPRMFNYHIATGLFILSFYFLTKYHSEPSKKHFILLHGSFILAILSFESTLTFPLASIFFFVFFRLTGSNALPLKRFATHVFIPQWAIIASYFLACKIWLGSWILHYGASTHLLFSIPLMMTNYVKYVAKFFLFYRYLPASRSDFLHSFLHIDINNKLTALFLISISIVLLGILFYRLFKKNREGSFALLILMGIFLISLLPVINLDTSFVGAVISDRYGYLPSVLFYLFIVLFIYLLFGKISVFANSMLVVISVFCLTQTVPLWIKADAYCKRLINNFSPLIKTNQKIYVLNMPDNYNWILNFRNGFSDYFFLKKNEDLFERVDVIAGFFVSSEHDSVLFTQQSANEFLVQAANSSSPKFLHHGIWIKSYSTKDYSVKPGSDCASYTLRFEPGISNPILVYIAGDQWRKAKPTTGEQ